jgi:hypothetical protein
MVMLEGGRLLVLFTGVKLNTNGFTERQKI